VRGNCGQRILSIIRVKSVLRRTLREPTHLRLQQPHRRMHAKITALRIRFGSKGGEGVSPADEDEPMPDENDDARGFDPADLNSTVIALPLLKEMKDKPHEP